MYGRPWFLALVLPLFFPHATEKVPLFFFFLHTKRNARTPLFFHHLPHLFTDTLLQSQLRACPTRNLLSSVTQSVLFSLVHSCFQKSEGKNWDEFLLSFCSTVLGYRPSARVFLPMSGLPYSHAPHHWSAPLPVWGGRPQSRAHITSSLVHYVRAHTHRDGAS